MIQELLNARNEKLKKVERLNLEYRGRKVLVNWSTKINGNASAIPSEEHTVKEVVLFGTGEIMCRFESSSSPANIERVILL